MNFKKNLYLVCFLVTICTILIFQYERINNNAPRGYEIDKNRINEEIVLDNLSIKFLDFKENPEGDMIQTKEYDAFLELKNISNNEVNCMDILYSKLSIGVYNIEYTMPIGDIKKMKVLAPNEKVDIILRYILDKKEIGKNSTEQFVFYINPSLYKNKVEEVYKNKNKFYSKSVILGGVKDEKKE